MLRIQLQNFLPTINSAEDIFELFHKLKYPPAIFFDTKYKRKIEDFDFKAEEKQRIRNIYTVFSFEKNLTVFLVETTSLASKLIRYLAKVFSDRYDSVLVVVTKDYSDLLFVLPEYERDTKGKPKLKITKLFVKTDEPYYTALEILASIAYEGTERGWRDVRRKWKEAFNVERVTESFFEDYKRIFFDVRNLLLEQGIERKDAHQFTLQLLNRIMFIYFVTKKRWLNGDSRFVRTFWRRYLSERNKGNTEEDSFYDKWLKQLFFKAFNNRQSEIVGLPRDLTMVLYDFPFLNGGLFTENELDALDVKISDSVFNRIFDSFFERYNFTIKEDMPLEREVGVDPRMIGYVYESLANVAEEIYDRNDMGIFYTPIVEVYFMCRRSLVEYLANHLSEIPKDKLYEFVFEENKEEVEEYFDRIDAWRRLKEVMDNLSVVDPACGSGAFLVGMMNVLYELYGVIYKHTGKEVRAFGLKSSIVSRSLYGVDVMPWAIHAAELRLWLQLIIETEFSKEELKRRPLLPNLNLNLRVGDSLVQEIGGMMLSLKSPNVSERLRRKLLMLKEAKERYFYNMPTEFGSREEILEEEARIVEEIVEERLEKLSRRKQKLEEGIERLKRTKQTSLAGEIAEREQKKLVDERILLEHKLSVVERDVEDLRKVEQNLRDPEKKLFVWELDFAEIFGDKGGFDIVIGNPPYVRQEKISPPNRTKAEVTLEDRRTYKDKLIESVKMKFGVMDRIDKKSDYYVYFYFHGLSLLNEKGTFCFITSNSWLDVGFGKHLQEFLLKYVPIIAIYDNPKRSFEHASINTIIAVFGAPRISEKTLSNFKAGSEECPALKEVAKFVMFKRPFEEVLSAENLIAIDKIVVKERNTDLTELVENVVDTADYRVFPVLQEDLLEDGWEYPAGYDRGRGKFKAGSYGGNKWGGKFLRAPAIFYTILRKGKLVRLGDIAEVRFGIKTGANEFFYLPSKYFDIKEEGDYYRLIPKQDGLPADIRIEKEFLKSMLFSLKETESIRPDQNKFKYKLFYCNHSKEELQKYEAFKYVYWAERNLKTKEGKPVSKAPSVRGRTNWYSLGEQNHPALIFNRFVGERFLFLEGGDFLVCDVFFIARTKKCERDLLSASINNTFSYLSAEIIGRKTYGIGVMYLYGPEVRGILLPDCKAFGEKEQQILKAYTKLRSRRIKTIFEECGIDPSKPIREQEPNPLPDRAELDNIIFDELGLTAAERKEVYWSVCELVKQRLEKARSLKKVG